MIEIAPRNRVITSTWPFESSSLYRLRGKSLKVFSGVILSRFTALELRL